MKIIGLCGGSGSGKGVVSSCFTKRGIPVVDTDAVYHTLTDSPSECTRELASCFGDGILTADGALDRRALAAIVFANGAENKRTLLNKITHRHILAHTRSLLSKFEAEGYAAAAVDAPLLFESGFSDECDSIIAVISDPELRVQRIVRRDGISEDAARSRLRAQLSDGYLREHSDYVIENNGTLVELELCVDRMVNEILK